MREKPIQVAVDFDGVLAYNPFRVVRAPITAIKRRFLGNRKTSFHIPQTLLERTVWTILHESSVFPAHGKGYLESLVMSNKIEAHLVTARYSFLQENLFHWLDHYKLRKLFKTISVNTRDEQPHEYKLRVIQNGKFDYFIEDNWDIVNHLIGKTRTKVLWIYNIIDKKKSYPQKFPDLDHALHSIAP